MRTEPTPEDKEAAMTPTTCAHCGTQGSMFNRVRYGCCDDCARLPGEPPREWAR